MNSPRDSSRPARVLVVDDELSVREVLAEGLEAFGFEARACDGAKAAFEEVKGGGIDLILSDIDMPAHTGLELLAWIKERDQDTDVVMVTGVVDMDTAIRAIRDGAADYVSKPFNLEEVRIVVERTLEKRRLILENRAYQHDLEAMVEARTSQLLQKTREVERSYEDTLQTLVTALDLRDNETQGHSWRVVQYAVELAVRMGVTEPELSWIRKGAILHDVGKIGVPDAILRKPGKLDDDEMAEMRKHPGMGFSMLRHIDFLRPALDIVHCHQERYDGSGYPRGLKADEIPLGARIFAVVDTFDAMTSDRPYRAALPIEAARDEIARFSGRQFDPEVARIFLSIEPDVWKQIRERVHLDLQSSPRPRTG